MNKKELEKLREKIRAENPLLTQEQIEDIIAEKASNTDEQALAKEKERLEAEKEALAKEKAAVEAEKQAALSVPTVSQVEKTASLVGGKAVTYECKTRCTFNGQYYREGDLLIAAGEVPDFFQAVGEGA